jgi:hypothetical protein
VRLRLKKRTSINSIPRIHKEKEMADFRKWFYALAVVALLAGLSIPASAHRWFYAVAELAVVAGLGVRARALARNMGALTPGAGGGESNNDRPPSLTGTRGPRARLTHLDYSPRTQVA